MHIHFGNHARHVGSNAVITSGAGALQSGELRFRVARRFFRRAQVLICGELQIETLLRLFEFFPGGFLGVLRLLKLKLRRRAQLDFG